MVPKWLGLKDSSLPPRLFLTLSIFCSLERLRIRKFQFWRKQLRPLNLSSRCGEDYWMLTVYYTSPQHGQSGASPKQAVFLHTFWIFFHNRKCAPMFLLCFCGAFHTQWAPPFMHHPNLFLLQFIRFLYLLSFSFFPLSLLFSVSIFPAFCLPDPVLQSCSCTDKCLSVW